MKISATDNAKNFSNTLRKNATFSEVLLWNKLKNKQFHNLDFDRQKAIGKYIADFYCPQLNLVIEIDGCSHNNKSEYDMERHNYLTNLGLYVLHIKDRDLKFKMANVLHLLQDVMKHIQSNTAPAHDSTEWWR